MAASFSSCMRGVAGPQGNPGVAGATGATGNSGTSCTVAEADDNSGALITCGNTSAFIKNGTNGIDATPVTPVKFCSGATASYGSFPEYGLLINGKVYAIYATSRYWLSVLSPGNYQTTTTGLNCSFRVNSDGSISQM